MRMTAKKILDDGEAQARLCASAHAVLEKDGHKAFAIPAVARHARVSPAVARRLYKSREALLADIVDEGFAALGEGLAMAASEPGATSDRIAALGGAYMRFAAKHGELLRLMFGKAIAHKGPFAHVGKKADEIGAEIGHALGDPALGLAVWGAVHGLTILVLDDVIDLGQKHSGLGVLPSRAEILLRSLFARRDI